MPAHGFEIFEEEVLTNPDKPPVEAIQAFVVKYPRIGDYVSFLLGVATENGTNLFSYDVSTGHRITQVRIFGIGSGMYPKVSQKLYSLDNFDSSKGVAKHLRDTVNLAKEIDETRRRVLYSFGTGVLDSSGYRNLTYEKASSDWFARRSKIRQEGLPEISRD